MSLACRALPEAGLASGALFFLRDEASGEHSPSLELRMSCTCFEGYLASPRMPSSSPSAQSVSVSSGRAPSFSPSNRRFRSSCDGDSLVELTSSSRRGGSRGPPRSWKASSLLQTEARGGASLGPSRERLRSRPASRAISSGSTGASRIEGLPTREEVRLGLGRWCCEEGGRSLEEPFLEPLSSGGGGERLWCRDWGGDWLWWLSWSLVELRCFLREPLRDDAHSGGTTRTPSRCLRRSGRSSYRTTSSSTSSFSGNLCLRSANSSW
uniref:Uncharacterized protein n=1 Tax=Ixodes ricinus TaxID=34613 RepID=A0A6B0V5A9_IXORI